LDWQTILIEIEDVLIPHYKLDVYERNMYFYLLIQTRIRGIESATIPLPTLSNALGCSEWQSRKTIRQLAEKGCIDLEQTRKGHLLKVFLPSELGIQAPKTEDIKIDIEEIDFFNGRKYISELIKRENGLCFYCLSEISPENCELDHVVSQLKGVNNSYRNIVAACHKCNTRKQSTDAEDFLRSHYRKGLLSEGELESRLSALEALKNGEFKPII
jgi:hypothetical protein